ncbi:MAG: hypothetical protein RL748_215 [Pseudomonadota bacterium]|jgi:CRISPR system Cascade subunit CasC
MSRFIQLHLLTNYPPSNLNRDDTGRPKVALMGGVNRLRISSQSQKRAWRASDVFQTALGGHLGTRTKEQGRLIFEALKQGGIEDKAAREWAKSIAEQFGKLKSDKKTENNEDLQIEQLANFSPDELQAIQQLLAACIARKSAPTTDELKLLRKADSAVDIAMFGRMLADSPEFNMEAAVQVSHAITVHQSAVEDDYFTAIDDLNSNGAAHIGERGYGAGLFYTYLCINREQLINNLSGNTDLTNKALAALLDAVTKVAPTGMQNSFASRAYASFVLAEKGNQQPRTLAQAFLKPIAAFEQDQHSMLEKAVDALNRRKDNFDAVYGACADERKFLDVEAGQGSLAELIRFVQD